jgi:hypothetical protein
VDHDQFVQKALGEDKLRVGQRPPQHVVLVDRQIIAVARVDLDEADAATLELELLEPLDHDLGIFAAAAVADVGQGVGAFAPASLGMGAAHGKNQRRLAIERHHHIGRDRVPFPMPGEPLHAAAEAPMTRAARHDHAIELVLAHFVAQRPVAALVFLLGEMVVDRVPVIGRVVHVGERRVLIEARAHLLPWLVRGRTRRLDVHWDPLSVCACSENQFPVFRHMR